MKKFRIIVTALRVRLARLIHPNHQRKLFIVLKFGGKRFLAMTEDEIRYQISLAGGVGVRFKDKSLVLELFEISPGELPDESKVRETRHSGESR